MKISILGWGSLLWDTRPEFDLHHGPWEMDGPVLPIEFSRVSETRGGALTLVIDHQHGVACPSAFSISTRTNPDDAIADLRCREGTTISNIGCYFADGTRQRSRTDKTLVAIRTWANAKNIAVVIWTDLAPNFEAKSVVKKPYSVLNAITHLQLLPADAKAKAAEYIWLAPALVDTPLRRAVQSEPWFRSSSSNLKWRI
jgi:hypothetical protein